MSIMVRVCDTDETKQKTILSNTACTGPQRQANQILL
jgi:hypothetical protein